MHESNNKELSLSALRPSLILAGSPALIDHIGFLVYDDS